MQRDTPLTATSASSSKRRVASLLISEQASGSLQSESRPATEMLLKKRKLWSPWEEPDAFNPDVLTTSESEHLDGQAAPPKGRKKKVAPPTKQGGVLTPVADLPMVVTRTLPRPLGKVAACAAPQTREWYEECDLESDRFQELLQAARSVPAAGHTRAQHAAIRRERHSLRAAQPQLFPVEESLPADVQHWTRQWLNNPSGIPWAIREEEPGRLNLVDLDVWMWSKQIAPDR